MEEQEHSLRIEADEVIREIKFAVKNADISKELTSTNGIVYFNLETKESTKYCVELTLQGFRIVGKQFDCVEMLDSNTCYYETIYAMLDSVSEGYRNAFGDTLIQKLQRLQDGNQSLGNDT